jgi:hypothetical protein
MAKTQTVTKTKAGAKGKENVKALQGAVKKETAKKVRMRSGAGRLTVAGGWGVTPTARHPLPRPPGAPEAAQRVGGEQLGGGLGRGRRAHEGGRRGTQLDGDLCRRGALADRPSPAYAPCRRPPSRTAATRTTVRTAPRCAAAVLRGAWAPRPFENVAFPYGIG